jgi:outer membrane receptor protein involved in Fe transport
VVDNLKDAAIFMEHRLEFSPEWSALYGLREDVVQLNEDDPLGNLGVGTSDVPTLTQEKIGTSWYGLHNGNVSVVYTPSSHVSAYVTYDNAQCRTITAELRLVGSRAEIRSAR